jgi:hypothetical protein
VGESVEGETVHGHKDRSRENGMLIGFHPVGVVVIGVVVGSGHGVLN